MQSRTMIGFLQGWALVTASLFLLQILLGGSSGITPILEACFLVAASSLSFVFLWQRQYRAAFVNLLFLFAQTFYISYFNRDGGTFFLFLILAIVLYSFALFLNRKM